MGQLRYATLRCCWFVLICHRDRLFCDSSAAEPPSPNTNKCYLQYCHGIPVKHEKSPGNKVFFLLAGGGMFCQLQGLLDDLTLLTVCLFVWRQRQITVTLAVFHYRYNHSKPNENGQHLRYKMQSNKMSIFKWIRRRIWWKFCSARWLNQNSQFWILAGADIFARNTPLLLLRYICRN